MLGPKFDVARGERLIISRIKFVHIVGKQQTVDI